MGLVPSLNHPTSGTADPSVLTANDDAIRAVVNGQIDADNLASNAVTGVKLGSAPHVLVYHSSGETIANTTNTALSFDSESFDSDGMHSTSANTSRLTCVLAGLYVVNIMVGWAINATGYRKVQINKNGATATGLCIAQAPTSSVGAVQNLTVITRLAVSDYVEASVYQNSGGSLAVAGDVAYGFSAAMLCG